MKAVCEESRAWLLDLLRALANDSGARDASALARQLMVLYDGAAVAAQMDGDANAARVARAVVEQLVPEAARPL